MPGWIIPAASAVISGLGNIVSGDAAARAEKRRIKAARSILERNLVDDVELGQMLRSTSRMFNAQLQNTLNTTALKSKGFANSNVVGAAAAGQVTATKAATLAQTEQAVEDRNTQIRDRIAMLEASNTSTSDPVGDFVGGAVAGGIAGAQFSRTLGLLNQLDDDATTDSLSGLFAEGGAFSGEINSELTDFGTPEVEDIFDANLKPKFNLNLNFN